MQKQTKARCPSLIETNRYDDTFVQYVIGEYFHMRLFSRSCQEAREAHLPCQDYALCLRSREQRTFVFCVSDGVGSSYRGDFAAYYLSQCLVDWLQTIPDLSGDSQPLATQLERLLGLWAEVGHSELCREPLPQDIAPLLREVLEEQRDQYGSETVFFGGRIDFMPVSSNSQAPHPTQALLCWMGNVSAYVSEAARRYRLEQGAGNDRNRWSTLRGPRGDLTVMTMACDKVDRLLIHTDGLDAMSEELMELDDEALQTKTDALLLLPTNDDMTMLDLQWRASRERDVPQSE